MPNTTSQPALSNVLLTGPNLAYSMALHDSLQKLNELKLNEGETKEYRFMFETLIAAILSQPAIGDA